MHLSPLLPSWRRTSRKCSKSELKPNHFMETFDLGTYMSGSIRNIMTKAYRNVLSNPREAKFAYRMQTLFQKSEKRRQ